MILKIVMWKSYVMLMKENARCFRTMLSRIHHFWVESPSNHTWLKAKPWTKRPSMQGLGADSYLSKLHAISLNLLGGDAHVQADADSVINSPGCCWEIPITLTYMTGPIHLTSVLPSSASLKLVKQASQKARNQRDRLIFTYHVAHMKFQMKRHFAWIFECPSWKAEGIEGAAQLPCPRLTRGFQSKWLAIYFHAGVHTYSTRLYKQYT